MLDKSKHEDAAAGRIALLHKHFVSDVRSQPIPVRQQISNRPSTSIFDGRHASLYIRRPVLPRRCCINIISLEMSRVSTQGLAVPRKLAMKPNIARGVAVRPGYVGQAYVKVVQ